MKKIVEKKSLKLGKEIVRALVGTELEAVQGGERPYSRDCSSYIQGCQ